MARAEGIFIMSCLHHEPFYRLRAKERVCGVLATAYEEDMCTYYYASKLARTMVNYFHAVEVHEVCDGKEVCVGVWVNENPILGRFVSVLLPRSDA